MKIKANRIMLLFIVTGAYWYRLFTSGSGLLGTSYLYSVFSVLAMFIILMTNVWSKRLTRSFSKKNIISKTTICYTIFVVYAIITLFWASDQKSGWMGVLSYLTTALIIIEIPILAHTQEDLIFICRICLINVLITCGLALYECFSGNFVFGYTSSVSISSWSFMGMHSPIVQYNHPNNLSCALLLSYPFCIIALNKRKNRYKLILVLIAIAMITIFIASDSRLALIIFGVYFGLWALINGKGNRKIIWICVILLIGLFVATVFADNINTLFHTGMEEARPKIWENAFNNFLSSSGAGVGVGNAYIANAASASASYIGRPCHNQVLEILEETGIVGCTVWMIWFVLLFKFVNEKLKSNNNLFTQNGWLFLILFIPMTVQQSSMLGSFTIWVLFGIVTAIGLIKYDE